MNASSVAVLRARLPYVDRRALSEAWFSALHLASDEQPPASRRRATPQGSVARAGRAPGPAARGAGAPAHAARAPKVPRDLGAATERTFARRESLRRDATVSVRSLRYPPVRASFHLAVDGGRVQILVRRQGTVLHVIALCSERHVELVRRALVCADLHLRARGERVQSSVRAFDQADCFA